MLRSILQITGVEQKLQGFKARIESEAQGLLHEGKAVAIQAGLTAAMSTAAAIILLMAFVAALGALYFWLAPQFGPAGAMAAIAGGMLIIGAAVAIGAISAGQKIATVGPEARLLQATAHEKAVTATAPVVAERTPLLEPPRTPVTAEDMAPLFAVAGHFAQLPRTGIEPVDNMLRALAPKAEEATREAVTRAANLVRYGDRTTLLAVLGSAFVLGWAITKVEQRNASSG